MFRWHLRMIEDSRRDQIKVAPLNSKFLPSSYARPRRPDISDSESRPAAAHDERDKSTRGSESTIDRTDFSRNSRHKVRAQRLVMFPIDGNDWATLPR